MIIKKLMDEIELKMKAGKKTLVTLAIVFVVGFAGGMLTEHIIHLIQAKASPHTSAKEHSDHCADGHMDDVCFGH